ncbi:MAG: hypothetical protein HYS25_03490 [Ignavibacteriales bacterium]|nr:hypothetical protein [Ignavibacteriales bacterium]
MSATMRKAVGEIITLLKKLPEPGKKNGSFWDFMKNQLVEESEWDQKHIKIIEKEIDHYLTNLDKKNITDLWNATPAAEEHLDDKKIDTKKMKADITDEMIGQVMDRMDDNYSSRDSHYASAEDSYFSSSKKSEKDEESDLDEDSKPEGAPDEDVDLQDEDLFNDESESDEDEYKY